MKKFMFALALILGVTGIAGSALAESYDVDVKANAQNHIGWRAIYALIGCELRPPDTYSVGRQPQHGKVTLTKDGGFEAATFPKARMKDWFDGAVVLRSALGIAA